MKSRKDKFNLFDIFNNKTNAKQSNNSGIILNHKQNNTLHSNAARWNEVLTPKSFVFKKKKKKKISVLKKKILMERLKLHIKLNIEKELENKRLKDTFISDITSYNNSHNIVSSKSTIPSNIIIFNFLDGTDLDDTSELNEVISDIKELLEAFISILKIEIYKIMEENISYVLVTFPSQEIALSACNVLNGMLIAGQSIQVILDDEIYGDESFKPSINHYDGNKTTSTNTLTDAIVTYHNNQDNKEKIVLYIDNLVSKENMIDPDEVQEVLSDLRGLALNYGPVKTVWIEKRVIEKEKFQSATNNNVGLYYNLQKELLTVEATLLPWAIVQYPALEYAIAACNNLNILTVGGNKIQAYVYDINALRHNVYSDYFIIPLQLSPTHDLQSTITAGIDDVYASIKYGVRLRDFVTKEQILDEDEVNELFSDINTLLCETILPCIDITHKNCMFAISEEEKNETTNEDIFVDIIIIFPSIIDCLSSVKVLNSKLISGALLSVDIVMMDNSCFIHNNPEKSNTNAIIYKYTSPFSIINNDIKVDNNMSIRLWQLCDNKGISAIIIKSYFTKEDFDSFDLSNTRLTDGYEDLVAMKRDLLILSRSNPNTNISSKDTIHSLSICCKDYAIDKIDKIDDTIVYQDKVEDDLYTACVEYYQQNHAEEAIINLEGRVIGGIALKLHLEQQQLLLENDTEEYEYTNKEHIQHIEYQSSIPISICNSEIIDNGMNNDIFKRYRMMKKDCIYTENVLNDSIEQSDNSIISTITTKTISTSTQDITKYIDNMKEDLLLNDGSNHLIKHSITSVSQYKVAQSVAKQDFHSFPRSNNIPVADEITNTNIKELLKLISTFQMKAKEKNSIKAKQKLRFICGMKQCTNAVKANRVRLLLLAPNTEVSDILDEKIDIIIHEAKALDIPICYCLSKRILGKSCQLSMKQSIVAILDPDGAYEYFKSVISFITTSTASIG